MKRHICAGAGALLLALAGAGTATASGLPLLGEPQLGVQSVSLGDQSVDEQSNEADVGQYQGNGNVNVSPAIAIGGDASSWNAQGNGNSASADVAQANEASQSQSVEQAQSLENGSGCCGAGQEAVQAVEGGDQSVGEQSNEADVGQYQGNGNVNVSPAIAIDTKRRDACNSTCSPWHPGEPAGASTRNAQGNGNDATAWVTQMNTATQTQSSRQEQSLPSGDGCCGQHPKHDCCPSRPCAAEHCGQHHKHHCCPIHKCTWTRCITHPKHHCCGGSSQAGEQSVTGGKQSVDKQSNHADVTQKQGNGNLNVSPAIAAGGSKQHACSKSLALTCDGPSGGHGGTASTSNLQGNGNSASAWVSQANAVSQTQSTWQSQELVDACREVMRW